MMWIMIRLGVLTQLSTTGATTTTAAVDTWDNDTIVYVIENVNAAGKYLTIGNPQRLFATVIVGDKPSSTFTQWRIHPQGDGTYRFANVHAVEVEWEGYLMHVGNDERHNHKWDWEKGPTPPVVLFRNPGNVGNHWRIHPQGNGVYLIESAAWPGKYLNVVGSSTESGADVEISPWIEPGPASLSSARWRILQCARNNLCSAISDPERVGNNKHSVSLSFSHTPRTIVLFLVVGRVLFLASKTAFDLDDERSTRLRI
eukprot:gnl/MRDRNA2_/MRDRNA2_116092_c0_seq1.p1 gnl/MRDRNA2_/MRDRNA2_116092_c0~~gnl/MRDRNA2_/MRDRNA2_116092_c0_seq1.p1  ORF type:complete len:257 (+),score=28.73 gnl/MRDRNA2_/MRDRNA2_116092_c0_seq1:119-889(+)